MMVYNRRHGILGGGVPVIESIAWASTNFWTNHTIPTLGGVNVGDLLLLGWNWNGAVSRDMLGRYTYIGHHLFGTGQMMDWWYRVADGTSDDMGLPYVTTGVAVDSLPALFRITNYQGVPELTGRDMWMESGPDRAVWPISPSWGDKGALFISCLSSGDTTLKLPTFYPAAYSHFQAYNGAIAGIKGFTVFAAAQQASGTSNPAGNWNYVPQTPFINQTIAVRGT